MRIYFLLSWMLVQNMLSAEPLIDTIHERVVETIANAKTIPGLQAEEFELIKEGALVYWEELASNGVLEIVASDQKIRPYFVSLQGIIEHVLATELKHEIKTLVGVIHTPMPATPLCSVGEISNELVDPTIEIDPARLFTVKARTTILRDYLHKGGNLYVVYPKEGLQKRTELQQKIYKKELQNYPENLFDFPLDCASMDSELIGAFYLFTNNEGKLFAFAIQMTQANQPLNGNCQGEYAAHFGLWFGPVDHPAISKRLSHVREFIKQNSTYYQF